MFDGLLKPFDGLGAVPTGAVLLGEYLAEAQHTVVIPSFCSAQMPVDGKIIVRLNSHAEVEKITEVIQTRHVTIVGEVRKELGRVQIGFLLFTGHVENVDQHILTRLRLHTNCISVLNTALTYAESAYRLLDIGILVTFGPLKHTAKPLVDVEKHPVLLITCSIIERTPVCRVLKCLDPPVLQGKDELLNGIKTNVLDHKHPRFASDIPLNVEPAFSRAHAAVDKRNRTLGCLIDNLHLRRVFRIEERQRHDRVFCFLILIPVIPHLRHVELEPLLEESALLHHRVRHKILEVIEDSHELKWTRPRAVRVEPLELETDKRLVLAVTSHFPNLRREVQIFAKCAELLRRRSRQRLERIDVFALFPVRAGHGLERALKIGKERIEHLKARQFLVAFHFQMSFM